MRGEERRRGQEKRGEEKSGEERRGEERRGEERNREKRGKERRETERREERRGEDVANHDVGLSGCVAQVWVEPVHELLDLVPVQEDQERQEEEIQHTQPWGGRQVGGETGGEGDRWREERERWG